MAEVELIGGRVVNHGALAAFDGFWQLGSKSGVSPSHAAVERHVQQPVSSRLRVRRACDCARAHVLISLSGSRERTRTITSSSTHTHVRAHAHPNNHACMQADCASNAHRSIEQFEELWAVAPVFAHGTHNTAGAALAGLSSRSGSVGLLRRFTHGSRKTVGLWPSVLTVLSSRLGRVGLLRRFMSKTGVPSAM